MEHWEGENGHVDNTPQYLFIMLFKIGIDMLVLSNFTPTMYTSFMNVCSYSVFLADIAVFGALTVAWFLGNVSVCFILAHASFMYAALPLPVLVLGLLDYMFELCNSTCHRAQRSGLQNSFLILVVWAIAGIRSFHSTNTKTMAIEHITGRHALLCQIQNSILISLFCVCLSIATCCVLLPFCSWLPMWLRKANSLSAQRDNFPRILRSDPYFSKTMFNDQGNYEENTLVVETGQQVPPLYISLILCFIATWTPYIVIPFVFLIMGFEVPPYITVNMLWFECINSLFMGVVFWLKSDWPQIGDHGIESL